MTSIQLDSGGGAGGGGGGGATNLGYVPAAGNGIVTSSTGTSATIPAVDATNAGLMTPAQRAALIAAGGTNLSYTAAPTQGTVVSDTGTDATVPAVDATNAGLMLPAQRAVVQDMLTSPAQGDLVYYNGTAWVKLPAGTSGQFLKTNGAGANPAWAAGGGGGGSVATDAIWTAKGQLAAATGSGAAVAVTVGGNGMLVHADSSQASGISWGMSPGIKYASATYYQPGIGQGDMGSQSAATAQLMTWIPFYLDRPRTVAAIGNYCFTSEAGSTMRLGIYTCSATNFEPDALIADYGTVSGASTGLKAATGSTVIGPGIVFIGSWPSNHTTVRWSKISLGGQSALGINPATGRFYPGFVANAATDYSAGLPATMPSFSIIDSASSGNAVASALRLS